MKKKATATAVAMCALAFTALGAYMTPAPTAHSMKLSQVRTDGTQMYPYVKLPNGAQFVEKPEIFVYVPNLD